MQMNNSHRPKQYKWSFKKKQNKLIAGCQGLPFTLAVILNLKTSYEEESGERVFFHCKREWKVVETSCLGIYKIHQKP